MVHNKVQQVMRKHLDCKYIGIYGIFQQGLLAGSSQ